jgi:hypothetical protein
MSTIPTILLLINLALKFIYNAQNGLYYQAILVYLVAATGGAGIAPISNVCMEATFQTSLV